MTELLAFLLGIIQGLTEFLPVSSSGHLELAKSLFNAKSLPEESLLFTIVLHGATALSTVIVFRKDIWNLLKDLCTFELTGSFYFTLYIVLSMIPAALVGFFMEELIFTLFDQNIAMVGLLLIFTGGLLFLADKAKSSPKDVSASSALIIGLMQALAVLPGISRSGATIATAVLLGIDKEKAARFSFLMVIPLIFGSMGKSVLDSNISLNDTAFLPLGIGFLSAFFTGIIACKWMISIVKKAQLTYFAFYCFALGSMAILYTL